MRVARILYEKGYESENYLLTAVFHDLLEDTDATEHEIKLFGGEEVLEAVKLVTKERNYNMDDYIGRISNNHVAKMVKLADRLHNLKSAVLANNSFRIRYIKETEKYYLKLAESTVFEDDIKQALSELKESIKN